MTESYQSKQFFEPSPPPRIMGVETEYFFDTGNPDTIDKKLVHKAAAHLKLGKSVYDFHRNGAKLYVDGFALEYASAEALGPADAAASDLAGSLTVNGLWEVASKLSSRKLLRPLRRSGGVNVQPFESPKEVTLGNHENLYVPIDINRPESTELTIDLMVSHLASRAICNGSGMVGPNGYVLSQKAAGIGRSYVINNKGLPLEHGSKPALAVHLDDKQITTDDSMRFEVRYADPHMSARDTFMSLSALSLVARLVEQEYVTVDNIDDYTFASPIDLVQATSHNINVINKKHLSGAQKYETMLSMQQKLAELSLTMASQIDLPEDEVLAAEAWLATTDQISRLTKKDRLKHDFRDLAGWVEWATKYEHVVDRTDNDITACNITAVACDMLWTIPRSSIMKSASRPNDNPKLTALISQIEENADNYTTLPPSTRARARAQLINEGDVKYVDWGRVGFKDNSTYYLTNPYDTTISTPKLEDTSDF